MPQAPRSEPDQPAEQIAALPLRRTKDGKLSVLMVTSRDSGRWVMPKGWTMENHKPWTAAEIEALEEAGAKGHISKTCIGEYFYDKVLGDGSVRHCRVRVYPLVVVGLSRDWKERGQRRRRWFSLKGAARRVEEPDLAALLRRISKSPRSDAGLRDLGGKLA